MLLIAVAGVGAGAINSLVGSGTLITFPTLLAFGVPPVTANVSNNVGLVPGSLSGAIGYRRELAGQGGRIRHLLSASLLGGAVGAVLLLVLPARAFAAIVPVSSDLRRPTYDRFYDNIQYARVPTKIAHGTSDYFISNGQQVYNILIANGCTAAGATVSRSTNSWRAWRRNPTRSNAATSWRSSTRSTSRIHTSAATRP